MALATWDEIKAQIGYEDLSTEDRLIASDKYADYFRKYYTEVEPQEAQAVDEAASSFIYKNSDDELGSLNPVRRGAQFFAGIGRGLTEIRRRSPKAKVFVVGYGTYCPTDGCFPIQPYMAEPSNYIQGLHGRVNAVLQQQAAMHGAEFVSLQGGEALQHTSCAIPTQRWLEGLVPTTVALDFHPSALGMQNYAALVQTAINN